MGENALIMLSAYSVGIVVGVIIGGPILMFACWMVNQLLVTENRFPGKRADEKRGEEKLPAPLKTTNAGPYTAPGVELTLGISPSEAESQKVPIPNFIYAGAITACVFVAVASVPYAVFAFFHYVEYEWVVFRGSFLVSLVTTLLATYLSVTAIHSAMLPTTLLRGALISIIVLVPWLGIYVIYVFIFLSCKA